MVRMNDELSNKIANIGFVCSILVVFIHAKTSVDCGSLSWWLVRFVRTIADAAIPMFFFISGFLLVGHCEENKKWWIMAVGRRIKSLLVPYFCFTLLYILILGLRDLCLASRFGLNPVITPTLQWATMALGLHPCHSVLLGPMWYIRCLFIFVLISPLFVFVIKKHNKLGYVFAVLAFYASYVTDSASVNPDVNLIGGFAGFWGFCFRLYGFGWFLLGMTIRLGGSYCLCIKRCTFAFCAIVGVALVVSQQLAPASLQRLAPFVVTPLMIFSLCGLVPGISWPQILTRNSFAIYCLHFIYLYVFQCGYKMLRIEQYLEGVLGWVCVAVVTSFICIMTAEFIRKRKPLLARFVLGGR